MHHCRFCTAVCATYFSFLKHSSVHENLRNFVLQCGFDSCPRQYTSIRSLRVHLRRKHKYFVTNQNDPGYMTVNDRINNPNLRDEEGQNAGRNADVNNEMVEFPELNDGQNDELDFDNQLKCKIGKMLLGLRENHYLTSKSVSVVAQKMADLLELHIESVQQKVSAYFQRQECDVHEKEALLSRISEDNSLVQHLNALDSQKKLERFAKRELMVVEPTEYVLGHDAQGNPETLQFVSLKDTLKVLLSFQNVRDRVARGVQPQGPTGILEDVTDGTHFLQHPLAPHPNTVSIVLYMDEFTLTSPLRTQAKSYKVMATYFQIANLPTHTRSKLCSIHLVSLCKTQHIKKYGLSTVSEWLVKELKSLADEGITVEGINFKGVLLTCVTDNLAAHQVGAFFESFTSNHPCRFCTVSRQAMQNGNVGPLRTPMDHDAHVDRVKQAPGLATIYGLKGPSVLADVPHFHCTTGLPSDIAHDLFEGVLKDVISRMLKQYVAQGYFSIEEFNTILCKFPFMGTDKVDKPSAISTDGNVKQTMCKMWCLFRLLPLLIGDKVPSDDPTWQLYLHLRAIVEYLTAKRLKRGHIEVLRDLIQDYMEERLQVLSDVPLKPKDHYMNHYADQFVMFGPLVHSWTVRFESKHQQFLQIWRPIRCSKNVCKTLATRHQYQSAINLENDLNDVDTVSITLRVSVARRQHRGESVT